MEPLNTTDADKENCSDYLQNGMKHDSKNVENVAGDVSCGHVETGTNGQCEEKDIDFLLTDLPAELLLHVCSFLHAKFVVCTLSMVCKYFHSVISDDVFWKVRIGKRWPKKYPAIPVLDREFNWKAACMAREEQHRLWTDSAANMQYFSYNEGIFAPVDAVHLMNEGKLLAAGSRDRYLNLVDVTKLSLEDPKAVKEARVLSKMDAHKGWIWSLSSLDNILATGSWDTKIKFWDLEADGQVVKEIATKSAVLCTHFEPNFFVAGGYDKKIYQIDPRTATQIAVKRFHKQPVLCLVANDDYIVTGSEDKTIAVYDRRAGSVSKTLTLAEYPMSMSLRGDELWVGDKLGLVHLLDATDGDFNVVETYDVGHKGKVTGIVSTMGALYTCSTDKTIQVLEPSVKPSAITSVNLHSAEVADISFQSDILASASSDCTIGVWKPKDRGFL